MEKWDQTMHNVDNHSAGSAAFRHDMTSVGLNLNGKNEKQNEKQMIKN
jgi:hypothetical protein